MADEESRLGETVDLDPGPGMWERTVDVFSLALIATVDQEGEVDIAPKHLAMPMSWEAHYGFVCAPHHTTYRNIIETEAFTVNLATPAMVVGSSLAAAPRASDGSKPTLGMLSTYPATTVQGVLVSGCRLWLECRLREVVGDLGRNALVIGDVVAARAPSPYVRTDGAGLAASTPGEDEADTQMLAANPLLTYVHPGRVGTVADTRPFPFHAGFRR